MSNEHKHFQTQFRNRFLLVLVLDKTSHTSLIKMSSCMVFLGGHLIFRPCVCKNLTFWIGELIIDLINHAHCLNKWISRFIFSSKWRSVIRLFIMFSYKSVDLDFIICYVQLKTWGYVLAKYKFKWWVWLIIKWVHVHNRLKNNENPPGLL